MDADQASYPSKLKEYADAFRACRRRPFACPGCCSASIGNASDYEVDPRAQALVAEGRAALDSGQHASAIDAFEAALAVDPGYTAVYLDLAEAARGEGLQGKAIHYYREALERDPRQPRRDFGRGRGAGGEGRARRRRAKTLRRLESLCGETAWKRVQLAAAIDRGPRRC